jgi:CxxC motif-containing protein (DUF1111 family)
MRLNIFLASLFSVLIGCSNADYTEVLPAYIDGEEFLAPRELSVSAINSDVFGRSIDGFDTSQDILFFNGNRLFNTSWVPSPASTTGLDGLGPTFNAKACSNCHFKDGRGKPIESGASNSTGFLMRLSIPGEDAHGGPLPFPGYGEQLQTNSILNVASEGKIEVSYSEISGIYDDGTTYSLQKPNYTIYNENFGSLSNALTSPRVGTQLIGLGLIDAIPTKQILDNVDEFDTNNDGISGRANYVWDAVSESLELGKFGWKANQPNLKQQVAGAFSGDIGLTTPIFKETNCPSPQNDCYNAPDGEDDGVSEITQEQFDRVFFYQTALAVPVRRNVQDENVLIGRDLFTEINCMACHQTNYKTGKYLENPLLENANISPYSDFLLHDMGPDLADNRPDFIASGVEWRTQPLWGVGLLRAVNKHTFLLHDGRARNVEEAILWHGGEAENSKNAFKMLSKTKRKALIAFINSL